MKYIVFDCDGTLIDPSTKNRTLYPGILDLLQEFQEKGHKLFVWTARDRQSTLRILKDNGVLSFFEEISTIDDAAAKPNPEGLLKILSGVSKSCICMIGDSYTDILGAQSFGVMSIACLWNGMSSEEGFKKFSPDFIVNDPKECSKVIAVNLKGDKDV